MLYSSSSSSLCLLERLVHGDEWMADGHRDRVVLTLRVPPVSSTALSAEDLEAADPLWREEGNLTCRRLGDRWLHYQPTCALIVPSAANPLENNVLFNPRHPDYAALIAANAVLTKTPVRLDGRVVALAKGVRRARGAS